LGRPWIEAHYELAKLRARNNRKRAVEPLDALLAIWKGADATFLCCYSQSVAAKPDV